MKIEVTSVLCEACGTAHLKDNIYVIDMGERKIRLGLGCVFELRDMLCEAFGIPGRHDDE